jgi:hypothetical protein
MSVRTRRWIAALLVLVFSIGTMQAASALPRGCGGQEPQRVVAQAEQGHKGHAAMADMADDENQPCPDRQHGMSANDCAAFCLVAVPLPALVRLDTPELPAMLVPALDRPGQGWSPPGDVRPPRTSAIG